ncbi:MAG: hypothetical protein EOO20_25105, partial [Chryseobacterium sp.]
MNFFKGFIASCAISILTMIFSSGAYAQFPAAINKTSAGFLIGVPVGKSTERYINGYGFSVKWERNLAKSFNFIGSAGYMTFQYRDDIKKRLENLGEVNPTAIEAFTEMKKRYEFILEQKNDLVTAKDSLLQTIQEVEA